MDNVTHSLLGAAIGQLVLGKKIGNKAMLFGAIACNLPDLDVFVVSLYKDDLAEIAIHRSYSHALFPQFIVSFLLAWITWHMFRKKVDYKSWYWLWFLGLAFHSMLDACTTYGTRLFLPFSNYPVGFNNIAVLDPVYTFLFLPIIIYCLFLKRDNPNKNKWAWRSIYISSFYMMLTFVNKFYMHSTFKQQLVVQNIPYETLNTSPSILNNILWAGIAHNDSTLTVCEYSLFQKKGNIQFVTFKRNLHLEKDFKSPELETLKWFSQGMYLLEKKDSNTLKVYIAKWGRSDFDNTDAMKAFIFYYELKKTDTGFKATAIRPDFKNLSLSEAFGKLWNRMWYY